MHYNHSELREHIKFLRNQQEKTFVDSRIKRDESNQNTGGTHPNQVIKSK